jgi:hypothetical protein
MTYIALPVLSILVIDLTTIYHLLQFRREELGKTCHFRGKEQGGDGKGMGMELCEAAVSLL